MQKKFFQSHFFVGLSSGVICFFLGALTMKIYDRHSIQKQFVEEMNNKFENHFALDGEVVESLDNPSEAIQKMRQKLLKQLQENH